MTLEDTSNKFITTEAIKSGTGSTEQQVWDAVKNAFADRNCIGYWRYPIFPKVGEVRKEPDILVVDREFGLTVIEILPATIEQITEIRDNNWLLQDFRTTQASPSQ